MAKISVVVPVYNVEGYLPQCLDSIRSQSFDDIEIICVNDGSIDRSMAILEKYALVDDRIIIVAKKNGGLSSARNAGINAASGEYVMFVDSDDLLDRKACETVVDVFEKKNAQIVTFGAECYPSFFANDWLTENLSPRNVDYEGYEPAVIFEENSHPFVWRSSFRRSFLEEQSLLFDEEILFGEDQVFHFAAYPRASKISLISDKLYKYRLNRSSSLMGSIGDNLFKKQKEHVNIFNHIASDWHASGFLGSGGRDLLSWSIEFLLSPIEVLDADQRQRLVSDVCRAWRQWFGEDVVEALRVKPAEYDLVHYVLSGENNDKRIAGLVNAYKIEKESFQKTSTSARLRYLLKKILPSPAASMEERMADALERQRWFAEDAAACTRSLALLDLELKTKMSD